jgi:hypothetical protein
VEGEPERPNRAGHDASSEQPCNGARPERFYRIRRQRIPLYALRAGQRGERKSGHDELSDTKILCLAKTTPPIIPGENGRAKRAYIAEIQPKRTMGHRARSRGGTGKTYLAMANGGCSVGI